MSELKPKHDYKAAAIRITDGYIYLMLVLFPLFTGFHGYANITLSKYVFFTAATFLWLALLAICLILSKMKLNNPCTAGLLILAYSIFCCLSALFSPYKSSVLWGAGRFDGLVTALLCAGIFFGVSRFARPKRAYIYAAAAAVSLNCAIAVLQMLGYNPLRLFPGGYWFYDAGIHFSNTFLGTIGNAGLFSAYICLILPLSAVYYITNGKRPLFFLPAVFIMAFCLFVCGVSGGMLALAVTVLVASPIVITNGERLRRALEAGAVIVSGCFLALSLQFTPGDSCVTVKFVFSGLSAVLAALAAAAAITRLAISKSKFSEKPLRVFFTVLSVSAVAAGLLTAYFRKGTEGTMYELSQVMHGNIDDSFGSSRVLIWKKALALVPGHLLFGTGPGTLALRIGIDFSRFVEETGKTLSSSVDNAHNGYLGMLVNTGLLSLAAYVAAQVLSFIRAVKIASPMLLCLAFALLCYWVQEFFGLALFLVSPLMWLFWGLLASALRSEKSGVFRDELSPEQ